MQLDVHHQTILDYLTQTDKPIFLTGRAGTGKTTFLQHIRLNLAKEMVVVAPTAVAAINAGGVTIHSFFQVPLGPLMPGIPGKSRPQPAIRSVNPEKEKMLRRMQLLIIDEISMVRADTLDYIDALLRLVRVSARPFGGVQLLMIGDPYQLPPVANNDWDVLSPFYKSPYFFDSIVWSSSGFLTFELSRVYRQSDPVFIDILNSVRDGRVTENTLAALNTRCISQPDSDLSDYVTLSTHNNKVKEINQQRLDALQAPEHVFSATISADFPSEAYPAEKDLILKIVDYITENYFQADITPQTFADIVFLSPSRLASLFKQQTGSSLSKYLLWTRLRQAIYLILSDESRTLTDVAYDTGFYDLPQFNKYMYEMFGMPPKALKHNSDLIRIY